MKTILLFIAAMCFCLGTQAQVHEVFHQQVSKTITRMLPNGTKMTYVRPGQVGFLIFSNATSQRYVEMPSFWDINDMEVADGTVYFCGENLGKAVVGIFPVPAATGTTFGPMLYCICQPDQNIAPTVFNRLDVYRGNDPWYNIALVGETSNSHILADAVLQLQPDTAWRINFITSTDLQYTDIACLDDIIAVAIKESNSLKIQTFYQTPSFINTSSTIGQYTIVAPETIPSERMLIERIDRNYASVAYQSANNQATIFHWLKVDPSTGIPSLYAPSSIIYSSPNGIANWRIYDLHNGIFGGRPSGFVYLMERTDHTASGYAEPYIIKMPIATSPSTVDAFVPYVGQQMSFDLTPSMGTIYSTGISYSGLTAIYNIIPSATGTCYDFVKLPVYTINSAIFGESTNPNTAHKTYHSLGYGPNMSYTFQQTICY